ncbi:MAG TPA: PLD nuclease N-terminal domain-containing protein [Actinomycetaceae bacterium]|nr:PLD nuclease N-terminal domain-containing protein [Actinomycetaceae bacterium]
MESALDGLLALAPVVLVLLGVLAVLQLTLLIVGLVAWARTPDGRMPPPNRWLWLAVILVFSLFGPIAFLLVRRSHQQNLAPVGAGNVYAGTPNVPRNAYAGTPNAPGNAPRNAPGNVPGIIPAGTPSPAVDRTAAALDDLYGERSGDA